MCVSVCLYMYMHTTYMTGYLRGQKKVSDSQELGSQMSVSHSVGSEKKPRPSAEAAGVINH